MNDTLATAAEYLRLAIETDTLPASFVRQWADAIIAADPQPTGDIVEVSWSRDTRDIIAALNGVEGDRDFELAERWFCRTLHSQLRAGREPSDVIRAARHALFNNDLALESYYAAGTLEDDLQLADMGVHGSPPEVKERIAKFLDGNAAESIPPTLKKRSVGRCTSQGVEHRGGESLTQRLR
ncbi:hypothetical protein ACQ86G_25030 [Roseateles chitinivorans]|uniref:hypothetical protein n=1 Tax=Roseateles chitinivorans TaxID=2917965 RepID=UPI003D672F42